VAEIDGAVEVVKPFVMQSRPLVSVILSLPGVTDDVMQDTFWGEHEPGKTESYSPYENRVTVPSNKGDR